MRLCGIHFRSKEKSLENQGFQTEDKARRHLVGFVFFLDRIYKKWYNKAAS